METQTAALILAAGQGKRMVSQVPKVLHPCAGLPLIAHVVALARRCGCDPIVVVISPEGTRVRELLTARFPDAHLIFAVQDKPLGTGDAARAALTALPHFAGRVLVLCGDAPLLRTQTIAALEAAARDVEVAFLSAMLPEPGSYGRVVRRDGRPQRIVEQRDASAAELTLQEVNAGVYLCSVEALRRVVTQLTTHNAQQEFYLTDMVAMAAAQGQVAAVQVADANEIRGVNDRGDLAAVERLLQQRLIREHQSRGVTFLHPDHTWIGVEVELGRDVTVGPGVQLAGRTVVGDRVSLEGPCIIRDCVVGSDTWVHAFSYLDGARVAAAAHIGPYARLRPGTVVEEEAHVGNFVELKKTRLGRASKANHLAYLGDAEIGAGVNIGAGTITCNYDGVAKWPTRLGDGVFVGSNSTLVAPVELGSGAYVAAGSVITETVAADALAFGRARQSNLEQGAKRLRLKQGKKGSQGAG